MSNHQSFQRFAALSALVSFPLAVASDVLQGLPTNFSSDVFTNPAVLLSIGPDGANLVRWGLILDVLGYYLLLLPAALLLQKWCKPVFSDQSLAYRPDRVDEKYGPRLRLDITADEEGAE